MPIPKSSVAYSRLMKKFQVWSLFIGTLILLGLLFLKSRYPIRIYGCSETCIENKGFLYMVSGSNKGKACDEYISHVDLIELPNIHQIQEEWEREGYQPSQTEREIRESFDRGNPPDIDRMA